MKTIVFDLLCSQPVKGVQFHGGGEYTKMVFKYFVENSSLQETTVYALLNREEFIDEWIIELCNERNVTIIHADSTQKIMEELAKMKSIEEVRFFAGMVYSYKNVEFPSNVYSIGTCHGLRAIEKPTDKYRLVYHNPCKDSIIETAKEVFKATFIKRSIKRYIKLYSSEIKPFDRIITDSKHSLYSIRLNFPEYSNKEIDVFYPMTQAVQEYIRYKSTDNHYLMMISANRWLKNGYRAAHAIDMLYEKGLLDSIRTRIYGNMPTKLRKRLKHQDKFEFYEYVSSEELEKAYAGCSVFLYPTLNEGFGNVPMEAMKYGKTCVVSAVCSLPEVYQNSVIYCNPYDEMEIQNRILQAIDNKVDGNVIDERLQYLYSRQKRDMDTLCSIIRGKQD